MAELTDEERAAQHDAPLPVLPHAFARQRALVHVLLEEGEVEGAILLRQHTDVEIGDVDLRPPDRLVGPRVDHPPAAFDLVRRIREEGYTVLIVEQNIQQVLRVVDRAYLLETGVSWVEFYRRSGARPVPGNMAWLPP